MEKIILQEHKGRGCLKALCYKDIILMVVYYLETSKDVLAIYIRLVYYKGIDNKLKL